MTADERRSVGSGGMELKTRIWMNGSHEWFAYLEDDMVYLGGREVPYPLREGDRWTNRVGEEFLVKCGKIISCRR